MVTASVAYASGSDRGGVMSSADLPEEPRNLHNLEHQLKSERPHCHHYTLAHLALRQMALSHPVGCLGVLSSPNATEFLTDLWKDVDEHCKEHGETSTINPRE